MSKEEGVLLVGGKDYAVNLSWHSFDGVGKIKNQAIRLARESQTFQDFYCKREDKQFALGSKEKGQKSSMPSLAAHIAKNIEGSFIGAFLENDKYYIIAVKDGLILPEHDQIFGSEVKAKKFFFSSYRTDSEWDSVYAPTSWDVDGENVKSLEIEDLLNDKPKVFLADIERNNKTTKLFVAISVLILAIAVNYDFFLVKEQFSQKDVFEKDNENTPPAPPWLEQFTSGSFVYSCVEAVELVPVNVPGWNAENIICQKNGVLKVSFQRGEGTINWMEAYLEHEYPKLKVSFNDQKAFVFYNLQGLKKYPEKQKTYSLLKTSKYLVSNLSEIGHYPKINRPRNLNKFYRDMSFSLVTKENPKGFSNLIGAVGGSVVEEMKLDIRNLQWTIKGKIYEKLI